MKSPMFSIDNTMPLLEGHGPASSLLKAALLFYDTIVIIGPDHWADSITDHVCVESGLTQHRVRPSIRSIDETGGDLEDLIYPDEIVQFMSQYLDDTSVGVAMEAATNSLENFASILADAKRSDRRARPHWQERLLAHPLLKLYATVRYDMPYHGTAAELEELTAFFNQAHTKSHLSVSRELTVTLPPLETLPYEAIFDLRASTYLDEFRKFLHGHHNAQSDESALRDDIEQSLWAALGFSRPSRNGSFWSRMVAAAPVPVPVPLPNPFGVYREWVGAKSEKELFKTFGWLWFIQEVRQATRQWSENEINE